MLALGSAERCWDPQPPGVLKEAEIKQLVQARTVGPATQEGSQQATQPQCWEPQAPGTPSPVPHHSPSTPIQLLTSLPGLGLRPP